MVTRTEFNERFDELLRGQDEMMDILTRIDDGESCDKRLDQADRRRRRYEQKRNQGDKDQASDGYLDPRVSPLLHVLISPQTPALLLSDGGVFFDAPSSFVL